MPLLAHLLSSLLHLLLLVGYCQKQAIWVSPLSGLHSALSQINPPDSFTTLLITCGAHDAVVAEKMWQGADEFRLQQEAQLPDTVEFIHVSFISLF